MAAAAFLLPTLALLSLVDVRERRVPNRVVLPAAAALLAAQLVLEPERAAEWIVAAGGAAAALLALHLVYPPGLGMGDVKLGLLLGAGLGRGVVVALAVAWVLAGLYATVLVVRGGTSARRGSFAFVPFLSVGALVALLS